jgi:hypothetical protein
MIGQPDTSDGVLGARVPAAEVARKWIHGESMELCERVAEEKKAGEPTSSASPVGGLDGIYCPGMTWDGYYPFP